MSKKTEYIVIESMSQQEWDLLSGLWDKYCKTTHQPNMNKFYVWAPEFLTSYRHVSSGGGPHIGPAPYTSGSIRWKCQRFKYGLKGMNKMEFKIPQQPVFNVAEDITARKQKAEDKVWKDKYHDLYKEYEKLEKEVEAYAGTKKHLQSYKIEQPGKSKSESVAIALASDWHMEESVEPGKVNDMNEYTLDIARSRANDFARNLAKLWQMSNREGRVGQMVLGLLGDFITGNIHQDSIESCTLRPTEAINFASESIVSVLKYLLENTDCSYVLPCHSGNHSRITKGIHWGNEKGNSLEWLMYKQLAQYFAGNKRMQFIIAEGHHSYVEIMPGYTTRWHHGHAIRYAGGVGGLTIPAAKAIANWNLGRPAQLDCFGHHHTSFKGTNFVSNGSLIGWNPFAIAIKCAFEKPSQTFGLVNLKYKEFTAHHKIFVSK